MINPQTGEPMRPTSSVAASNAGGAGLTAGANTIMVFLLSMHYGGQDNIPGDWFMVLPVFAAIIGFGCHFAADLIGRWRFSRSGPGTGTGNGEMK